MSLAIQVENLSKVYQLGEISTGTLSRDLERWFMQLRGKNDYLKIGENDRTAKANSQYVYSLNNVNFSVTQGQTVGVIGRNGAGKSTLLKLLSRVTAPTRGKIKLKGRVASLLEVGTGFHPELTGRENVFLNGAILGMRKKEILRRFDEIVAFSGVERYIDTPVKRYSSGMYVRLAFAVAAHLESEILIVDEVLAVGDAEFQKKCLGKMGDISAGEGRTVLFVSHNLGAVQNLCSQSILLHNGRLQHMGNTSETIQRYSAINANSTEKKIRKGPGNIFLNDLVLLNHHGQPAACLTIGERFSVQLKLSNKLPNKAQVSIVLGVYNELKEGVFRLQSHRLLIDPHSSSTIICNVFDELPLKPGMYSINVAIYSEIGLQDHIADYTAFEITEVDYNLYGIQPAELSLTKILLRNEWAVL